MSTLYGTLLGMCVLILVMFAFITWKTTKIHEIDFNYKVIYEMHQHIFRMFHGMSASEVELFVQRWDSPNIHCTLKKMDGTHIGGNRHPYLVGLPEWNQLKQAISEEGQLTSLSMVLVGEDTNVSEHLMCAGNLKNSSIFIMYVKR